MGNHGAPALYYTESIMKHAVLINNSHIENFSVRYISSFLKHRGFRVSTIHYEGKKDDVFHLLPAESLELLAEYCSGCDLVGISLLTTHQLKRSIQINNYLKERIKAKIIWGGAPVICDPQFYLKFADYICAGEGERVMADLLEEKEPVDIKGLGYKTPSGEARINSIPDLLDINKMPIPYLDLDDGIILKDRKMTPLKNNLPKSLSTYTIMSVRGCPYNCSYCLSSKLKSVFSGKGPYIRKIEIARIIQELEWAKKNIPHLKRVIFDDDDFFLRPEYEIENLLAAYTKSLNLPIFYLQTNIKHITESRIRLIKKSGIQLRYLKIGLQSASSRVNHVVFNRDFNSDIFIKRLKLLLSNDIRVMLDVISGNPYETLSDKYASLLFYDKLLSAIRGVSAMDLPIKLYDHKLMFYPGAQLFEMAARDKKITDHYLDHVLLQRNTLRKHPEDVDHEALVVALFNTAVKKEFFSNLAYRVLQILKIKLVFRLMIRFNIVNHGYAFSQMNILKALFSINV